MTETPRFTYKALRMLEEEYEPTLKRRSPYWRPRPAACTREAHVPAWNWTHPEYYDGIPLPFTILDANGAFISAASSALFAHGELEHTGARAAYRGAPGYYRIDAHSWSDSRIVSPLGSVHPEGKIWVPQPTVELLTQLCANGYWPEVRIHDAWTCSSSVRFRAWATAVNNDRAAALRDIETAERLGTDAELEEAEEWYEAVKTGYSMAVQLMRGPAPDSPVKSGVKRPDWYDTIHAQHAASTWRKVWGCVVAGFVPVAMGSVDEVMWHSDDYANIAAAGLLKLDDTGIQLGAFKVKETITPEAVHS